MRVKGWSGRSGLAKVDLYTRGTVYLIVWTGSLTLTILLLLAPKRLDDPITTALAVAGPPLGLAVGVVCARLARRVMDAYLGQGEVPGRLLRWAVGMTSAATATVLALSHSADTSMVLELLPTLLTVTLMPLATVHALMVPAKVTALLQLGLLVLLYVLLSFTALPGAEGLAFVLFTGFMTGWMAFTARASMWVLSVMWELREARDVQARLAVAEERLRFGRDLHDVVGRNLAVVALKSELAVQLARRGRPEAVDQMLEVQRIARESQREVRDVVRGYREADLRVELEGARGVLDAAGIACTVVVGEVELPDEVQSALGWVVREAATNVLRHGDTRRCTISVGTVDGDALLVVENDGAAPAPAPGQQRSGTPGSGLAGLRERLSAVGGVLEAGPARGGRFRLTARVPLEGSGDTGGGGARGGVPTPRAPGAPGASGVSGAPGVPGGPGGRPAPGISGPIAST
ncbi:sensor histidine kinase [Streptomyces sp. NPDC001985]|uniref:sensor histidine kinase n=1 Tax=Streptomyces sp. NPDC001985 TaxID=3154406 RepID=UPI0033261CC4